MPEEREQDSIRQIYRMMLLQSRALSELAQAIGADQVAVRYLLVNDKDEAAKFVTTATSHLDAYFQATDTLLKTMGKALDMPDDAI